MPRTTCQAAANQLAPPTGAGYSVITYSDEPGRSRFAAWGYLPEACLVELCAVARKHGARPTDTSRFLTESNPH